MSLAEERKLHYLQEKKNREEGILNGIPLFYAFPKLGSIIKTIPRGYPFLFTAGSGIGKTQSWIGIFIYNIYYMKKYCPELNLNVRLVIVLLEDTEEMFIDRLYSLLFWTTFGIIVDADELHSRNEHPLSKEIEDKLHIVEVEVNSILEYCEICSTIYNPFGIYKWARNICNRYGKHYNKIAKFSDEHGKSEDREIYSHYEQYDKSLQVLMIVDNLNNLSQEMRNGVLMSERETINSWTRNYCRLQITKHWKWSCLCIQQQVASGEQQQFDFRGNINVQKLKPSLADLGGSKEAQRDFLLILGLFAPDRYGIVNYEGYDIEKYGDNFRTLTVLKSNLSPTNIEIPFYFNGACSLLRELPKPNGIKDDSYEKISELIKPKEIK